MNTIKYIADLLKRAIVILRFEQKQKKLDRLWTKRQKITDKWLKLAKEYKSELDVTYGKESQD